MFIKNSNQQLSINDPLMSMPKYLKDTLYKSWAHPFQAQIFPIINEDRFRVLYSEKDASRPNTPVNVIIGLLIIKEFFQLTDEELIGSLHFDIRYQYALRTTSFERQPVSVNTLYNFRKRLYNYFKDTGIDLIHQEIEEQAKKIGSELNIQGKKYRMDSFMISSSCKKLSRMGLIFHSNEKCVKYIVKRYPEKITESMERYLDNAFKQDILYRANYESVDEKYKDLLTHSLEIRECFLSIGNEILKTEVFELIERLIDENIEFTEDLMFNVIPSKNLLPTSLQSHTDPDATYRTKYGANIGYVGNVVERFDGENNVITYYDYKPNVYSDIKFSEDILEKIVDDETQLYEQLSDSEHNEEKNLVIVDGAYYGQEMANDALEKKVVFIPGDLVGRRQRTDKMSYTKFEIDDKADRIVKCPSGKVPVITELKSERYYAKFDKSDCLNCKYEGECPFIIQKEYNCIKVRKKQYQTELLRIKMKSDDYQELKRQRAAIEGVPSIFRRKYHVDSMPVRRLVRTKIWFGFKIAAINAKKLIKRELAMG